MRGGGGIIAQGRQPAAALLVPPCWRIRCFPAAGLPPVVVAALGAARLVALKMNLPSSCSRLIEDWVIVMVCPGFRMVSSPPGDRLMYLPPSRLSLVISAAVSFGSCRSSRTVSDTTAWKDFGSICSRGHRADLDAGDAHVAAERQAVDMLEACVPASSRNRRCARNA